MSDASAVEVADFSQDRLEAAKAFAQTMIVVDDEAEFQPQTEQTPSSGLRVPGRRPVVTGDEGETKTDAPSRHPLNLKEVVDSALELGVVCSVVRPERDDHLINKVTKAAERADIVSLDWEVRSDDGELASSIIRNIVEKDDRTGGRLRLIAIYTGVRDRDRILGKIIGKLAKPLIDSNDIKIEDSSIRSKNGLRIIWLFKKQGISLSTDLAYSQVSERELPERLVREFAALSEGLLSNVALATIGSIRDNTHHVLSTFSGDTDGPFFHHRANLENPADSEEFAVSIVVSELRSAVEIDKVVEKMAGKSAIERRIREMLANNNASKNIVDRSKPARVQATLSENDVVSIVLDGVGQAFSNEPNSSTLPNVKKKDVQAGLTGVFHNTFDSAQLAMDRFASLTGTRLTTLDRRPGVIPKLELGTIVKAASGEYLLCLQATCDAVRVRGATHFFFVPLKTDDTKPDYVVAFKEDEVTVSYLRLSVAAKSYTSSSSITFSPGPADTNGRIQARTQQGIKGLFFEADNKERYSWIATVKSRRAMRSVQKVSQQMTRIGFDEFEPYRVVE